MRGISHVPEKVPTSLCGFEASTIQARGDFRPKRLQSRALLQLAHKVKQSWRSWLRRQYGSWVLHCCDRDGEIEKLTGCVIVAKT